MKYPTLKEEKKLWKKGHRIIGGMDEAGRGPLAGPVIACCFCILDPVKFKPGAVIRDSKQLSEKQREEAFESLKEDKNSRWGIGIVSEKVIDKINILEASKLAMEKAAKNLEKKIAFPLDFILLDGNFSIKSETMQKSIIKGDEKVFSISCSSIIAKVTRDRMMKLSGKKYPEYGFQIHKGYPTLFHRQAIKTYGLCRIHRKSFCRGLDLFH